MRRRLFGTFVVGLLALTKPADGQASYGVTVRVSEVVLGPVVEHRISERRPATFRTRGWSCHVALSDVSSATNTVAVAECSHGQAIAHVTVICNDRRRTETARLHLRELREGDSTTVELTCGG